MNQYIVTGKLVTLHDGRVTLSADQAGSRSHNLNRLGGDVYEIAKPIQMKHGERFGYDGEYSKSLMSELKTQEQIRAEAGAKAKEEKKAKAKANEKTETMAQAVDEADTAVANARKAMGNLGDKIDPAAKQAIEQTIEDMGIFADDGDVEGLKAATAALVEHTNNLNKKK